jgi:hypothetical protein
MRERRKWEKRRKKAAKKRARRSDTMSMNPQAMETIPEETVRIARATCPKGTLAMRLRDALGERSQDESVSHAPRRKDSQGMRPSDWHW